MCFSKKKFFKMEEEKKKKLRGKYKGKPSSAGGLIKQKMVYQDWQENGFNNISKSMAKFGYAPAMVRNPKKMMATRTWQQIMQEVLPEDMLAAKHQELLLARRTAIVKKRTYSEDGKVEFEEETVVDLGPDIAAVGKGLELAYRIKGMYNRTPNGEDGGGRPPNSTIYNLFYKPEIKNSVKQLEDALKKQLYGEPLKDDDGSVPENYGGFLGSDNPAGSDEGQSSDVDGGDTGEDGGVERDGGDDGADTGR